MELGKIVRAYRKKLKMSQEELAALSGISERTLRDLEKGRLSVSLEKAVAVADVLGLKIQVIEA
ncbi:helix-turn-helix domain-containing protein [Rothia sp. SD9660Na]|uniref:helix-turn-helix transcriptional regulator n=1 Tax=Rothia sp. SD9660Na TaxID=3047030 RepID=UPI0024B979E0|nr:helix-turn-helix domain-containing protein [Rothia sp. SD9660Na]WHS50482.1 helix-turn-helix domain-containing protein [Rothia sp. SD9660Na]